MAGPVQHEEFNVTASLDSVANILPNAHASPLEKASLMKNEGTIGERETIVSGPETSLLRVRLS
jgi:hypothetical protein